MKEIDGEQIGQNAKRTLLKKYDLEKSFNDYSEKIRKEIIGDNNDNH